MLQVFLDLCDFGLKVMLLDSATSQIESTEAQNGLHVSVEVLGVPVIEEILVGLVWMAEKLWSSLTRPRKEQKNVFCAEDKDLTLA